MASLKLDLALRSRCIFVSEIIIAKLLIVFMLHPKRSITRRKRWVKESVIYIHSGFFPRVLNLFKMALWFGFAAVAGAFGGLLAFGVQHIHSSVQNWRLLFIIEVSPNLNHDSRD